MSYPVRECLLVILTEEWEHRLYADRDLDLLTGSREAQEAGVLYRMRVYQAVGEDLPLFHEFFLTWLPPLIISQEEVFMTSTVPPARPAPACR